MVEVESPAALPRGRAGARKASRAASASIRSFFSPQKTQHPEIADEEPGEADETDFDVPAPGKRKKKKKNDSPKKPERENRKVRSSKRLAETQQKIKDDDEAETKARVEAEQITDLWKEARVAAEEYAVLSAGKPVHPFFLRKNLEQQPAMQHEVAVNPESLLFPAPPFHVLQSPQNFETSEPVWNASVFEFSGQDQCSLQPGDGDYFHLLCTEQSSTLKILLDKHTDNNPEKKDARSDQNSDMDDNSNRLWTDYYHPKSAQEVCGNPDSVASLNDWLRSWKQRILTKKLEIHPSKLQLDDDKGWFQEDGYDDEAEEDDGLETTLLLTGPVGCGKSAAVYACANEQGFNVIEINASDNRNGAAIKHTVGEASESQALNWWSLDPESSEKNTAAEHKMTMILFEEVDTVFEEDKGFVAALVKLAKTAKRPIILTSNCPQPLVPYSRRISFSKPEVEDLVAHASLVCSTRGVSSGTPLLMKRFVESHEQDLRKLMMSLQFWGQGSSFLKSSTSSSGTQFDSLSQLVSVSFPSSFSRRVAREVTSAVEEAEKIEVGALVERLVARAAAEAQAQRALRKQKIQQRRASLEGDEKRVQVQTQPGKRRRLKKLREIEVKACGDEVSTGFIVVQVNDLGSEMNNGLREAPGVELCGSEAPEAKLCGTQDFEAPKAKVCGTQAPEEKLCGAQAFEAPEEKLCGAQVPEAPEEKLCGTQAPDENQDFGARIEASAGVQQANDPVKTRWLELKTSGRNFREFDHSSGLKVLEALANASEGFSSSDLISSCCVEDEACSEFSSSLAQRSLHHVLESCSGFILEDSSFLNPSWHEQQSHRINRQKILEEEIFLTHPKMTRHCFNHSSFSDYISLMARIVKLEEIQKTESLRPKNKRSRGYQEDYLSERNVTRQGIHALQKLFVFDNTYTLTAPLSDE